MTDLSRCNIKHTCHIFHVTDHNFICSSLLSDKKQKNLFSCRQILLTESNRQIFETTSVIESSKNRPIGVVCFRSKKVRRAFSSRLMSHVTLTFALNLISDLTRREISFLSGKTPRIMTVNHRDELQIRLCDHSLLARWLKDLWNLLVWLKILLLNVFFFLSFFSMIKLQQRGVRRIDLLLIRTFGQAREIFRQFW